MQTHSANVNTSSPFFLASSIRPKAPGTRAFRIVLHESHSSGELVVHHQNMHDETGEPAEFYWGHYYPGALSGKAAGHAALGDYIETCIKYGLNPTGATGATGKAVAVSKPASGLPARTEAEALRALSKSGFETPCD